MHVVNWTSAGPRALAACSAPNAAAWRHSTWPRCGILLLLLAASAPALQANAAESVASRLICPPLMLDNECRVYRSEIANAATTQTRDAVKARYAALLSERKRACYCNPERSWIPVTPTTTAP